MQHLFEEFLALSRLAAVGRYVEDHPRVRGMEVPVEQDLLSALTLSAHLRELLGVASSTKWTHGPKEDADLIGDAVVNQPHAEVKIWAQSNVTARGTQWESIIRNAPDDADLIVITTAYKIRLIQPDMGNTVDRWRVILLGDIAEACEDALRLPHLQEVVALNSHLSAAIRSQSLHSSRLVAAVPRAA